VVDSRYNIIYPGGSGKDWIVTVSKPVFEPYDKIDLKYKYRARACDMEAARLIEILMMNSKLAKIVKIVFCKVCGDRPDDYELFKHEYLIRGWYRKGYKEKLKLLIKFPGGPRKMWELLKIKRAALDSLTLNIHEVLKQILDSGESTDKLDSIFYPYQP